MERLLKRFLEHHRIRSCRTSITCCNGTCSIPSQTVKRRWHTHPWDVPKNGEQSRMKCEASGHRLQGSKHVQTGSDLVSPCFTRILAKLLWWLVAGDPNEPCGTATQMSFSAPISCVTQCMRVSFLAGSIKVYTKKTDGQHFTLPTPQRDTSLCGATRPRANLPYNWRLKKFLNFKSWTNQEAK